MYYMNTHDSRDGRGPGHGPCRTWRAAHRLLLEHLEGLGARGDVSLETLRDRAGRIVEFTAVWPDGQSRRFFIERRDDPDPAANRVTPFHATLVPRMGPE